MLRNLSLRGKLGSDVDDFCSPGTLLEHHALQDALPHTTHTRSNLHRVSDSAGKPGGWPSSFSLTRSGKTARRFAAFVAEEGGGSHQSCCRSKVLRIFLSKKNFRQRLCGWI